MGKYFGLLVVIFFLTSCEKEEIVPIQEQETQLEVINRTDPIPIDFDLDGRLPIDSNGYYHLKLVQQSNQTIHRISGKVYNNKQQVKIEWQSNLYWWILYGQVVASITKTYINYYTGEITYVNLPPLVNWKDQIVPTINSASYSGTDGEINTVIAPIREMKGDTMVVTARIIETQIKKQIKIVLE